MTQTYEIELRTDTAANWTAANPVLGPAEAGYEKDTKKLKFGDGVSSWTSLAYFTGASGDGAVLQAANNLSDLASASTARTNLDLGTAATQPSSAFDVSGAATAVLSSSAQKANNLSDLGSVATARTNLGVPANFTRSAVTTSGNLTAWEEAIVGGSGNIVMTTPASMSVVGTRIMVTRGANTNGTIEVAAAAGQTVNGVSNITAPEYQFGTADGQSVTIESDGTSNWAVVATVGTDWGMGWDVTGSLNTLKGFYIGGQVYLNYSNETSAFSLSTTSSPFNYVNASSGNIAISLTFNTNILYFVKRIDSSTNSVTLTPSSGTIDGQSSITLTPEQAVVITSDGTNYHVMASTSGFAAAQSGALGSNLVLVANTMTTVFTLTLPVGRWIVNFNVAVSRLADTSTQAMRVALGTAAGSIPGPAATSLAMNTPTATLASGDLTAEVNVTAAGTVLLQIESNAADTVLVDEPTFSLGVATGYTANVVG